MTLRDLQQWATSLGRIQTPALMPVTMEKKFSSRFKAIKKTFERNMAGWISAFSAAWWAKNPHPKISNTRNHKQGRTITLKEVRKLDWCVTYFSASCTKDFNLFRLLVAAFRIPGKATGCCNVSVDTLKSVPLCQSTTVKKKMLLAFWSWSIRDEWCSGSASWQWRLQTSPIWINCKCRIEQNTCVYKHE